MHGFGMLVDAGQPDGQSPSSACCHCRRIFSLYRLFLVCIINSTKLCFRLRSCRLLHSSFSGLIGHGPDIYPADLPKIGPAKQSLLWLML